MGITKDTLNNSDLESVSTCSSNRTSSNFTSAACGNTLKYKMDINTQSELKHQKEEEGFQKRLANYPQQFPLTERARDKKKEHVFAFYLWMINFLVGVFVLTYYH